MSAASNNRLMALAADIRAAHAAIRQTTIEIAERTIAAGHMLIEAKVGLAHGDWGSWLADHAGLSPRTARRYMQIARSGLKSATVADLGLKGAAAKLARSRIPRPALGQVAWGETNRGIGLLIYPVEGGRFHVVCAPVTAQFDEIVVTDKPVPAELLPATVIQAGFPVGAARIRLYKSGSDEQRSFEELRKFGFGDEDGLAL